MPFSVELQIGMRHLRSKRRVGFVSITTWISVLGIMLGVAALIVVIGVMFGFERELQRKILGTQSHVVVVETGAGVMRRWPEVLAKARKVAGVVSASPFVYGQVLLSAYGRTAGTVVRGVDPAREMDVTDIRSYMRSGSLDRLTNFRSAKVPSRKREARPRAGLVIGAELASSLGVVVGDRVVMVSPVGSVTPMGVLPRMRSFEIVGTFRSGFYQFDSGLVFVSMKEAQEFFDMGEGVTGVHLRVRDIFSAERVSREIQRALGHPFWVRSWLRMNRNLFSALKTERTTMTILLLLVIIVAAFNIVGSLVMVVMEKGREIAILMSMGATGGAIVRIFFVQGAVIGLAGSLLGTLLGLGLGWKLYVIEGFLEKFLGLDILPASVYHIDKLPVHMTFLHVAATAIAAFFICLVATLYPAWRAARVDPVEKLRYS